MLTLVLVLVLLNHGVQAHWNGAIQLFFHIRNVNMFPVHVVGLVINWRKMDLFQQGIILPVGAILKPRRVPGGHCYFMRFGAVDARLLVLLFGVEGHRGCGLHLFLY